MLFDISLQCFHNVSGVVLGLFWDWSGVVLGLTQVVVVLSVFIRVVSWIGLGLVGGVSVVCPGVPVMFLGVLSRLL